MNQTFINKITIHLEFSLKLKPSIRIHEPLGIPQHLDHHSTIKLWVQENWGEYSTKIPKTIEEIMDIASKMNLDLHQILTHHFHGHSWQHTPEYPDL